MTEGSTIFFLDIKAAFDSVSHSAILEALVTIGLGGRVYTWIANYLQGRQLFMSTAEGHTAYYAIKKGVPQGAVLSPLVFNLVLLHLKKQLPRGVHITMYADDICIWSASPSRYVTQQRLQKALANTSLYLTHRGLHLSPEKSVVMAFSRKSMKKYPLIVSGRALPYVRCQRFLGVIIDRSLSWSPQVNKLCARISAISQVIRYMAGAQWDSGCH